jgi:hypothetical protein
LEGYFLPLLEQINANTTVVAKFLDFDEGIWNVELGSWATKWESYRSKGKKRCNWTAAPICSETGFLRYHWKNKDEWTYEHEGDCDSTNGVYSLLCKFLIFRLLSGS